MQLTLQNRRLALLALACTALAGCASTQPVAYTGLSSAPQLRTHPDERSTHTPYRLAANTDWRRYTKAIVAPVAIYQGADQQFEDVADGDKTRLAGAMRDEFRQKLAQRFALVDSPAADTLLIELTLTGAKTTTPFLSTATRFDLVGAPYNIVQAIRGKEGSFTGSVSYAVEIYEASTHALLAAFVSKQYPNALNLKASLGSLDASIAGIRIGADELLAFFK
ncbi:MAG: DUF3313 domain-containing protein [Betaproteobacteria bacterium]